MYLNAGPKLRKLDFVPSGLLLKFNETRVVILLSCLRLDGPSRMLNDKSMVSMDANSSKLDAGNSLIKLLLKLLLIINSIAYIE